MTIRNRELSQFGSFIYIENNSKDIGITTEATPYVGIGTTNAEAKLHVVGKVILEGDVDITGILSASSLESVSLNTIWTPISGGDDVYRPVGNVGIGTSTNLYKLSVNGQIQSLASQGTSPFVVSSSTQVSNLNSQYVGGKSAPGGDIVGTNDIQTLTNKTITFTDNTISGTLSQFNSSLTDGDFATIAGTQTLTNKTLTTPVIAGIRPSAGQLQTIPSGTGTLVSTNSVGIITTGMIGNLEIVNEDVSNTAAIEFKKISTSGVGNSITNSNIADATIENAKLVNSTISGIPLGSNLNALTSGTDIVYSSGTTYNGSAEITISVNSSTAADPNTIVKRDDSGTISISNLTATGIITASSFVATSDESLKKNISTISNPIKKISQIRGVDFEWEYTGRKSIGVIAQEVEAILPELIDGSKIKAVNYNGLIGVLIEAVKELSLEIEQLKNK